MDIELAELRNLNPQFRRDIIPGNTKPYSLRLPYNQTLEFIDYKDSIVSYKDSVYFNPDNNSPSVYATYTIQNLMELKDIL